MAKLPADSIVMTDAGFGLFGVAYAAKRYDHDFLLRMKKSNFKSLRKKATLVSETRNSKTFSLKWTPTASNRKTQPGLPDDAALDVILHEVTVNDQLTLYLVTNREHDANTLAELYTDPQQTTCRIIGTNTPDGQVSPNYRLTFHDPWSQHPVTLDQVTSGLYSGLSCLPRMPRKRKNVCYCMLVIG